MKIKLKVSDLELNSKLVIRKVFSKFFYSSAASFSSTIARFIPNPKDRAFYHVLYNVEGPMDSSISHLAQACDSHACLVAFAANSYPFGDASQMDVLVRVLSGTLRVGDKIGIYSPGNELEQGQVEEIFISGGRYKMPLDSIPVGNWALIRGVDVSKTATLLSVEMTYNKEPVTASCFKSLNFRNKPLMKLAIEPLIPSELPKMLAGLKSLCRTYPSLQYKVEDSGEHNLLGTGELYLDCAMHDLRKLYTDIEIKVADSVAKFAETVGEGSYLKCFAESPNGRNRLTFIAETLETKVLEALESGRLPSPQMVSTQKEDHLPRDGAQGDLSYILQNEYGWDVLAARSIWAFGPDPITGPCVLIDDTLPEEVDRDSLLQAKDLIIQGFRWACREGPLCEENVRGVKFKLIDAIISTTEEFRSAGQIVPTVRRTCYSAMLTASPRLMEPVRLVEIQTQNEFVEAVYGILVKRRGHVIFDAPKAGTPLYVIRAYLPLMDSFGFETDLRIHTQGMAFCLQRYDHWQIVTGDPLDSTIKLIPLEPSPAPYLARDYLLKTRRRKGLGEDVKISKFLDEAMMTEIAREEALTGIKGLQF